jgi:hypothetical protein
MRIHPGTARPDLQDQQRDYHFCERSPHLRQSSLIRSAPLHIENGVRVAERGMQ